MTSPSITTPLHIGVSLSCNLLLVLILLHTWSSPCTHQEAQHLQQPVQAIQQLKSLLPNAPALQGLNGAPAPPVYAGAQAADTADGSLYTETQHSRRRLLSAEDPISTSTSDTLLGPLWTPDAPSPLLNIKNDLSLNISFHLSEHEIEWKYCAVGGAGDTIITHTIPYCPQTPEVEQKYQMSWFGTHVVPGDKRPFPQYLKCVHLPPTGYQWPDKWAPIPAIGDAVHWPNLRVATHKDLYVFNKATPKNLYHFDAQRYDLDALSELEWAAQHIPFGPKIRLMLDVGAGGGSLGLLLKRKYDVQVLSTVFADWPYCEYITERGGLCMLVDVMEPMPFAKFSFDVLHVSWVYHGQHPEELLIMFNEINRIIRPGGYLWMRGGWSQIQVDTLRALLMNKLGYQVIIQQVTNKLPDTTARVSFGPNLPYHVDWDVIFVKPIAVSPAKGVCNVQFPARLPAGVDSTSLHQQLQQPAQEHEKTQVPQDQPHSVTSVEAEASIEPPEKTIVGLAE